MPEVYHAFIDGAKAKEMGIDLINIESPHRLWNGILPSGAYFIFLMPNDTHERERMQNGELYRSLESNPVYTKVELHSSDY